MNRLHLIDMAYDAGVVGIGNAFGHVDVSNFFININFRSWYIVSNPPKQKFDHLLFFSTLAVNGIKFLKQFHISLSFNKSLLLDFIKGKYGFLINFVIELISDLEQNLTVDI